jgi:hypothetical protein
MKCFHDASYTKRKGCETMVEVIGGADKYMAVCRRCFYSPKKNDPASEDMLSITSSLTHALTSRKLFTNN